MKATLRTAPLRQAFALAASIVPTRPARPQLGCVLLDVDNHKMIATDLEQRIELTLGDIQGSGRAMIPAAKFRELLNVIHGDEIKLSESGGTLTVESARAKHRLSTQPPDEFPGAAELRSLCDLQIPAATLCAGIAATSYACDVGSARWQLGAVALINIDDRLHFAATNGHRVAMLGTSLPYSRDAALIPVAMAKAMRKIFTDIPGDVKLSIGVNAVEVSGDGVTYRAQQVEGVFPNIARSLPSIHGLDRADILAESLLDAVRSVAVTTADESRGIELFASPGELRLESQTAEIGKSEASIPLAGQFANTTLDGRYFAEFLASLQGGQAVECYTQREGACEFRAGAIRYVQMPMARGGQ